MIKTLSWLIVSILIALAMVTLAINRGCLASRETTARPPKRTPDAVYAPLESHIGLSVRVHLQAFQDDLARVTPASRPIRGSKDECWERGWVTLSCEYDIELIRARDPTISGNGRQIAVSIPISARGTVRSKNIVLNWIPNSIEADFTAVALSHPRLNEAWSLELDLDLRHKWDGDPTLKLLGFIPLRIESTANELVRSQMGNVVDQLNARATDLDIADLASDAWDALHQPFRLSTAPEVWLRLQPQGVNFSQIQTSGGLTYATVVATVKAESSLDAEPEPFDKADLPLLGTTIDDTDDARAFRIRFPLLAEYEILRDRVQKALKVKETWAPVPKLPDHYLTVEAVDVYPSGTKLVVGIQFRADTPRTWLDTHGQVYLWGSPYLDLNQRTVSVRDLKLTSSTDSSLVDVTVAFLDGAISRLLMDSLVYRFGKDYDRLLESANDAINRDLGNGMEMRGRLDPPTGGVVSMHDRGVYWTLLAEGELSLDIGVAAPR